MKNNKGLTLIGLAITIVVMIIISAVAIGLAINSNGIFNRTYEAKNKVEEVAEFDRAQVDEFKESLKYPETKYYNLNIELWQYGATTNMYTTTVSVNGVDYISSGGTLRGDNFWYAIAYNNIKVKAGERIKVTSAYGGSTKWYNERNNQDAYLKTR